jgi:ATP-dependent DNA ligase
MAYPIEPPIKPMLAKLTKEIPTEPGWLFEPKWDGFRAIAFRDGDRIHIGSRNSLPLERYFPEVVEMLKEGLPKRSVVDGEIIVVTKGVLDFDALQLRLHPAKSRVEMLAKEIPATFVAFDILGEGKRDLMKMPATRRREELLGTVGASEDLLITPQTSDPKVARRWFKRFEGAGLDGLIAKAHDLPYVPDRRLMAKIKHVRTADCVVGGYRLSKDGKGIGSLLLGLYDDGELSYVGHTSSFSQKEKRELLEHLKPLRSPTSFSQTRSPGGQSRWTGGKEDAWIALEPRLVCEVAFDHMQGVRFRHGTTFRRWRTDKSPSDCTFEQIQEPKRISLEEIKKLAGV